MNSKYEIGFIITPDANEEEVKKIIELLDPRCSQHYANLPLPLLLSG